jgi:DHA1 family bicyclomycin/chloramphenicol resistance-like MFS transporter
MAKTDRDRIGRAGGARAGLVVFLVCVFSLNQFAISIFLPAMPAMAKALGAGGASAKATLTVYLFVYAIAALIHGPLSDRYGRRPVLLVGLGLYTLASFACALAPGIEVLLAARVFQAIGAAAGVVVTRAIARDTMDGPELVRTNAYLSTGQGVAPGLAPLLGGLLAGWGDWTWTFHVTGLIGLALLAAASRGPAESNRQRIARIGVAELAAGYASVLRNRAFLGAVGAAGLSTGPWYGYFAASPDLLIDRMGVSPAAYGVHILIGVVVFMVAGMACARLAGRYRETSVLGLGMAASFAGVAALAALAAGGGLSLTTISLALYVYAAGQGFVFPITATAAVRPFPTRAGTAASAYLFLFMTMAALGSIAPALIHADLLVGLPAAMAIMIVLSASCLIGVYLPAVRAAASAPPA